MNRNPLQDLLKFKLNLSSLRAVFQFDQKIVSQSFWEAWSKCDIARSQTQLHQWFIQNTNSHYTVLRNQVLLTENTDEYS